MRKVYFLLILLCSSYALQAQTIVTTCSGVNIAFSDPLTYPTATGYTWTVQTTTGGVTGASLGTGATVSQTLSTTALTGGIATYSVTENGTGTNFVLEVHVNPVVTMTQVPDQILCYGSLTSVTFTSALTNASFNWIKDPTPIGLAGGLTGTGNISSFSVTTNQVAPVTSVFAVTPFSNSCAGAASSFSITVFPLPTVNTVSSQAVCNGFTITATTFTGQLSNTIYQWTTTNVSIAQNGALGSTFSGTGDIPAFLGNAAGIPATALIIVTPMSHSCSGTSTSFSLTVNPTPTVNPVSNILICNNTLLTGVTFTGVVANTTYNWTNNNPGIGLSAGAAGNIAAFTVTNGSTGAVTALVTVTPVSNTCSGTSTSFTILVNPSPSVFVVADQVLCTGSLTNAINFGSSIPSSTFNWTSSINSIGLPFNGSGNITPFTGTNITGGPLTALVTVTPVTNTCSGTPYAFSITINPIPTVNTISNQVFCDNTTITGVNFSSPNVIGSTFSWSSNTTSIGLALAGSTTVNGFTATTGSSVPVTALITVTASSNTCTGPSVNFQITVNPTPVLNSVADQNICAGTLTSAVTFGSPTPGATYNWTNTATSIGIGFTGTSNISSFTGLNGSNAPVTALIAVTPISNTCSGIPYTFSITINPTPLVNAVPTQIGCENTTITGVTFSGSVANAQYNWTSNTTAIGIAAGGTATVNAFSGVNGSNAPVTAIITVTAVSNTCAGPSITFSYTINPTPTINAVPTQVFCNGVLTNAVIFSGPVTGTTFNWSNDNTAIGLGATGTGNIGVFSATNTGSTSIAAFVTITPTANACIGTATSYSITVNPTPGVTGFSNQSICDGTLTTQVNFSSLVSGALFSWTNTTTSIGLASAGSGTINAFTGTNTTGIPVAGNIIVTAISNSCVGAPGNFVIVVNPVPVMNIPANQVVCNGILTTPITFGLSTTIVNTTFTWSSNNGSIGIGTGPLSGNIAAFTATNFSTVPVTADFTVTAVSNTCSSAAVQFSITVNPTPTVTGLTNQVICDGTLTAGVTFGGNLVGSIYNWTNSISTIGLAVSGSGTINPFTGVNGSSVPIHAAIVVTPFSNTCSGISQTFTITINPVPVVTLPSNQVICNGVLSAPVNFTGSPVGNTVYTWTNADPTIGLSAGATGNITAFTTTNPSNVPVVAVLTVNASSNTCTSLTQTFTITVNPTPTVIVTNGNQVICDGLLTTAVTFAGNITNTTYNWTNTTSTIGLAVSGSGTITPFTVISGSSVPVYASIVVTPFSNTCNGTSQMFTITVNPVPVVTLPSNQVICNGVLSAPVNFTGSPVGNTIYTWTNADPTIGLSSGATGNITAFTTTNPSNVPVVAVLTVNASSNTCTSLTQTFTITVNPTPTVIVTNGNQVICDGLLTTAVTFAGNITNTTYNWTNTTSTIGLAVSGSGTITPFTVVSGSSVPVYASIVVTPFSNTCNGTSQMFTITVNPVPVVTLPSNQVICNGVLSAPVNFTGSPIGNTIYTWTNADPTIGLSSGATGNITAFTTTNPSNVPVVAVLTVNASSNTCTSLTQTFTITVNPTPTVIVTNGNQVICDGLLTTAVTFAGNITNTTYNWTNTTSTIGLAVSGSGTITPFTVISGSSVPVYASIVVTPFSNTCNGTSQMFTITVNPVPVVTLPSNQVICNGVLSAPVNFTGSVVSNTIYTWTNADPTIGLSSGATGNITAFTTTNPSNVPVVAVLTVNASSNTCTSLTQTFTITVNPTPTVIVTNGNQVICDGLLTTAVTFAGNITNTTYNWTNTTSTIGLAVSGSGTITPFTVSGSNVPVYASIVVTPFSNTCNGTSQMFTITVNPVPVVTLPSNQVICNGVLSAPVNFTGSVVSNTIYTWTNADPTIGLSSGATGNITAFTTTNPSNVPVVAVLTVNASSNTCTSLTQTFTITVNPTPTLIVTNGNQVICDGLLTTAITFSGNVTNTTYNWTNTTSGLGLAVSGSGTIAPFTVTTSSNVPVYATIVVTPFSNTCTGTSQMFTITVNPVPVVTLPSNQVICNGVLSAPVNFSGSVISNTQYTWTNSNIGIGLGSGATGDITAFTTINPSNVPVVAVLTVNASSNTCTSLTQTFTITVNPTPTVNSISSQVVCLSISTTAVIFTGNLTSTTYNWTNTTTLVGLGTLTGTGNIGGFVTTNGGSSIPIGALIVVTPFSNNCSGVSTSFTITVNPTPTVIQVTDQFICNTLSSSPVVFTGLVSNTTYQWIQTNPGIGLASLSGTGNIAAFSGTNGGAVPINSVLTVTPISNTCSGTAIVFSYVVNPTPTVNAVLDQVVCNGVTTTAVTFTGGLTNTVYSWLQTNATVGLAAISGTNTVPAFAGTNSLGIPINTVITVTPLSNACTGNFTTFSIVVNPTPTVTGYANQILCNTDLTTAVIFGGAVTATTYQWLQTNPAAGLTGFTGTGNIPVFSATNPNFYPINTVITVTPMSNACGGTPVQFTYVVNPTPTIVGISDQAFCTGITATFNFSGFLTATVYAWTQTNAAIGLTGTVGTGNLSFVTTNVQSIPIHSVVTVTPMSNTCSGASTTFSIIVNPMPTVGGINDQFLCNGTLSSPVVFTGNVLNTSYQWLQTNVAVGLVPFSSTGNIAAFTATAPGNVPVGSLVIVTPISNTCSGAPIQFSLIANPTPTLNPIADQIICNGLATTAVAFTGLVTNTTYNWTHPNPGIGLAATSGSGTIASFTTTNVTNAPISSLISVIPMSNSCPGIGQSFSIVVNPIPTVVAVANQVLCNGFTTTTVVFTGAVPNTRYDWTNTSAQVGLVALTGTGNIASFVATNPTNTPINAGINVIPFSNTCQGTPIAYSYIVNPTPTVVAVANQVLCNGFSTTAVVFSGFLSNTTYNWVSTSIGTGLTPLTGTGTIASFTALNISAVPTSSSVTVTPLSNACTGAANTFTFTVNPTPTVANVTSQSVCNGQTVTAVNFTGVVANTTYSWTNSNSGIGLAPLSGIGNIAAFIGTNAGTAPISAQLTVIPLSNSCTGTALTFSITVNPIPVLTSSLTPPMICSGAFFSYTATSATVGTGFSWNRSAIASINSNATGSGVTSINEQLFSTGTSAVVVPYVYILSANGCTNAQSVTVAVNPTPTMNSTLVPTAICSGTIFSYVATSPSPGATFSWIRIFPAALSSGGAISAATTSIAQTIANSTTAPALASYAFTVASSGCANPQAFTVTFNVNPLPVLSSTTTPADICSGVAFAYAATSATIGTSFAWTRTAVTGISSISAATGTGNNIFNVLDNSNTVTTPETYTILMTANNCSNSQPVVVNVYPVPVLNTSLTPAPVCSNAIFNYTPGSATGTTFTWTRPFTTGIANPSASGSGDPAETLVSTSPLPVNVIYTYSVITAVGCNNAQTVTATINPLPTLSSSLTPAPVCSGNVFNYPPTSATPGTVFNWRRSAVTGIPNGASTGFNNPSEILSNPSLTAIAVIYSYTLTANSCSNTQPVTVFVNPVPVIGPQTASICSNSIFTVTPTNVPTATLYTWATPVTTPIGSTLGANAQATGVTPISQFLNNQTTNATTVVYSVLPTASGCSGSTFTITVNVNPTPVVGSQTMTATCSGTPFNFVSGGVPAGTTYTWAAPGLIPANALTGGSAQPLSQPSVSQTLNSTNNIMDTAVYSVTPATVLCVGSPFLLSVPIKPLPLISNTRDTICSGNAFTLNPAPVPANTTYTWTTPVISPFGAIAGGAPQSVPTTGISQTLTNNTTAYAQAAYTVTPSAQGCAGPTFLLIETVNRTIPTFTAQSALVCSGTAFNANPATAPAGTLYTWPVPANPPPAGITGSSAMLVPVANVSQVLSNLNNAVDTVIYTVTPLINNCPGINFLATIRVMPLPKATISGPASVCANTIVDTVSLAFNGTAPWSFTYSDGITTNTKTGITSSPYKLTMPPILKSLTKRTITVINVKDASCSNTFDTSFFTQAINPLPVGKVISLHGNYLCNGIKDTLFIQSPDSLGYQWQLNGTNIAGAILDSIATTTGAGSYNAILTNKFGCVDTAAIPVNLMLVKPPVLKMTIDTTCINSITTFTNKTDTAFTGAIQWNWTFGNGQTASTMNATTTYAAAGNYHVILKATQLSCTGYPPVILDSTVNIKFPIPALANAATSAIKGELTPVAGRSIPGYKYQWVPSAGIQNPDSPSTIFNFGATQQYVIKLISPEGCITNDSLLVRVFDENTQTIFVPKSFTPNGDGVNDVMYPYIAGIKQFHYFRVLNRYGKMLFETKTENVGWNGMLNGTPQPMGIYFWFAEGIGADGSVVQKSGQFLLIR